MVTGTSLARSPARTNLSCVRRPIRSGMFQSISCRPSLIRSLAIVLLACGTRDLQAQSASTSTPDRSDQAPPLASPAPTTGPLTVCNVRVGPPAKLPPPGSPPVVYVLIPCFQKQGGASVVEPQTYLYYIQAKPSRPSQDVWVTYDATTEATLKQDFRRLWATNFLDDLKIETFDYVFANGVIGKVVLYDMEERQRVKVVDYAGTKQLEATKIDEKL